MKKNYAKLFRPLISFILLWMTITETFGQSILVKGIVSDGRENLEGVSVIIKRNASGVKTDAKGHYTIQALPKDTLLFSNVGYASKAISIVNQQSINVILLKNTSNLDEVVVIGYGAVKKGDLTGAVTAVKANVLEESRQSSFINSLQGRVAGLQITSGSGEPGSGAKITIRGANTLFGDSRPLFVIDGIPVNESEAPIANSRFGANSQVDPLSSINPADIFSIEVLKDASATAIYGARGANGVIIVTTKKGREGAPQITYDGRSGLSYTAKRIEMLSAEEFIDYRKDWVLLPDQQNIVYGYFKDYLFFENANETEPSKKIPRDLNSLERYDWQDEMYRKAAMSYNHNLSIDGGTPTTKFFGSLGYNKEEGLFINNGYSRLNSRLRIDHNDNKRFSLSMGLNGTYSRYNGAVQSGDGVDNIGITQTALVTRPVVFVNPMEISTRGGWHKPTDDLKYIDRLITTPNLSSYLVMNYRLMNGMYIGNTVSGTILTSKVNEYYSKNTPWGFYLGGRAAITNTEWHGWANSTTLSYGREFKNNSKLNALGVFEISGSRYEMNYIVKSSFADESTGVYDISKGVMLQGASSNAGIANRLSYLGRLNYDFLGRYLLTGSFRIDGSDRFGQSNRYGWFPSAAFAWRVSDEPFFKNQSLFSNLKLRLSYGATGNSSIPEFQYMARMGTLFYDDQLGLLPSSLPNPDLKWETTVQYNAGLDLAIWKGRVEVTLDLYDKNTTGMLYNAIVPAQSGFKTQWQNLGRVTNRGVELALNTKNVVRDQFSWSSNFTISYNKNTVRNIGNDLSVAPVGAGTFSTSYIKQNTVGRIMVGQPIGVMFGYKQEGIYQFDDFSGWVDKTGEKAPNNPDIAWQNRNWVLKEGIPDASGLANLRPGTFKFSNADGSADHKITESDKVIIGNSQPKFYGGVGNNFSYKSFDAGVYLTYSVGSDIFNSTKYELEGAFSGQYFNITKDFWENRWTPDNPTNKYPSYGQETLYNSLSSLPNSYYVEDGSYLRLQTLSISYNLNKKFVSRYGFRGAKIYYSGNNLFTLTKYSGFTPEVDSRNPLLTNFDTIGYPRASSHSLGLSFTF